MAAILYPNSKDVMGKGGVLKTRRKRLNAGGGREVMRMEKKIKKLKEAQTCGAGSLVCFVYCPRTLDLDGFVD